MKSIKYIFPISLLLGTVGTSTRAQTYCNTLWVDNTPYQICWNATPATIRTPCNTPVPVLQWVNTDWSANTKDDLKNAWLSYYNNRITFEAEATAKYNCHTWAWAGGTTYWMNPPNQAGYWNDYSYIEVSNPPAGAKVRYLSSDHSAITTSTSDHFSSKWASGPRFTHSIDDSPFFATNLKYYIGSIFGPNTICGISTENYSIINPLQNTNVTWSSNNPHITIHPTTGEVTHNLSASGTTQTGTISAEIKNSFGNIIVTIPKNISVGSAPFISSVSSLYHNTPRPWGACDFEDIIRYNGQAVTSTNNPYGITAGEWKNVSGSGAYVRWPASVNYGTFSELAYNIIIPNCNAWSTLTVEAQVHNDCGPSGWKTISYSCGTFCSSGDLPCGCPFGACSCDLTDCDICGGIGCSECLGFSYSPNPASDELIIDFSSKKSNKNHQTNTEITYSIKLFDNMGVVQRETKHKHNRKNRQKSSVKLNVSRLREGTYFLHIEANGKIHKEQIIIKR
jgi:hypothetical protein